MDVLSALLTLHSTSGSLFLFFNPIEKYVTLVDVDNKRVVASGSIMSYHKLRAVHHKMGWDFNSNQ